MKCRCIVNKPKAQRTARSIQLDLSVGSSSLVSQVRKEILHQYIFQPALTCAASSGVLYSTAQTIDSSGYVQMPDFLAPPYACPVSVGSGGSAY